MNLCKNILFILAFTTAFIPKLYPQPTNLKFDQIGLEQGLSQSTVYAIVQDKQGFMWFGTQDGLNRYDGYTVTVFKHDPLDSNSISDNTIWSLICDKYGDLWIGTMRGGVNRYVSKEKKFYNYKHKDGDTYSLSGNDIIALLEDNLGNIWAVERKTGLNLFDRDGNTFTYFPLEGKSGEKLGGEKIRTICEDNYNNIWLGTQTGLLCLKMDSTKSEPKINDIIRYNKENSSLYNNDIRTLFIDKKGILWIGTSQAGISGFNVNENKFIIYEYFSELRNQNTSDYITAIQSDQEGCVWISTFYGSLYKYELKTGGRQEYYDGQVRFLYKDNTGILWIGTDGQGVMLHSLYTDRFKNYFNNYDKNKINDNSVDAVLEDSDGELWVASYLEGLKRYNRQRDRITFYNKFSGINYTSLLECPKGIIWLGTEKDGLDRFEKKTGTFINYKNSLYSEEKDNPDRISALCKKGDGGLWISDYNGFIYHLNVETNTVKRYHYRDLQITSLYEDKKDRLWIGTIRGGLLCFNINTKTFKQYLPLNNISKGNKGINNSSVLSIHIDTTGILWIGTYGGGLNKFDPEKNTFEYFTTKNGLPNDVVYGILPDKKGNLWISTNIGISRFNIQKEEFRNYDARDGLQSNEFNQGASFLSATGEMFFGGVKGFNSFYPQAIANNKVIPRIYITEFKLFNERLALPDPIPHGQKIEVSYFQNFFSFEFTALNYISPEKNLFAYRLEEFDKDWHYVPAAQRYASYTNLDPGKYVLHVKGSNNDGIWNETGTSITIIITPPFWMTWWFRLLMAGLIAGIFYLIYYYRVNQLMKMERMRLRIASDLHDELGSDLSAMALASSMTKGVDENDKERLNKIRENSLHVIEVMREIIWFIKPEHDNPFKLNARMKETADSVLEGINYKINLSNNALASLPGLDIRQNIFLIYKECLTNVARHSKCTTVDIEIVQKDNDFLMRIADNGKGFDIRKVKPGNGLNNIRVRAERIKASLIIESFENQGTIVQLICKNDAYTSLKLKRKLSIINKA